MINYIRLIKGEKINQIESNNSFNFDGVLGLADYIKIKHFIGFFQNLYKAKKMTNLNSTNEKGLKNDKTYKTIKIDFNA